MLEAASRKKSCLKTSQQDPWFCVPAPLLFFVSMHRDVEEDDLTSTTPVSSLLVCCCSIGQNDTSVSNLKLLLLASNLKKIPSNWGHTARRCTGWCLRVPRASVGRYCYYHQEDPPSRSQKARISSTKTGEEKMTQLWALTDSEDLLIVSGEAADEGAYWTPMGSHALDKSM